MNESGNPNVFLKIMVALYSFILNISAKFFKNILWMHPRVRNFFEKRTFNNLSFSKMQREREAFNSAVVFYCSSAGEYEQAHPIAKALNQRGVYVHFLFFSESGYQFAEIRKESLSYSLAPLDTVQNWGIFFRSLRPQVTIVVRHELWPSFLSEASKVSKVFLINASLKSTSMLSLFLKKQLLKFFDKIFTVSDFEKRRFCKEFELPEDRVIIVGDSKYDRVVARVKALEKKPRHFAQLSSKKQKLILGSAWQQDCDVLLEAYTKFREVYPDRIQLVFAPHQPTQEFLSSLRGQCEKLKISCKYLSDVSTESLDVDLVLVDSVGVLFDLYSNCDFAFVGGAMHHEVHNVLEPAAFGLPVAFGHLFTNSHEASELVEKGLATVIRESDDCFIWMKGIVLNRSRDNGLQKFIDTKSGSTDRLLAVIDSIL
jgi:3-deoxy-D-manno-octulosonic-acid transferase